MLPALASESLPGHSKVLKGGASRPYSVLKWVKRPKKWAAAAIEEDIRPSDFVERRLTSSQVDVLSHRNNYKLQ
jgi:hypothetical protein